MIDEIDEVSENEHSLADLLRAELLDEAWEEDGVAFLLRHDPGKHDQKEHGNWTKSDPHDKPKKHHDADDKKGKHSDDEKKKKTGATAHHSSSPPAHHASSSHGSPSHSAPASHSPSSSKAPASHSPSSSKAPASHSPSSSKAPASHSSGTKHGAGSSGSSPSSSAAHPASPAAQHMATTLASKAQFYNSLANRPVGKNWSAQDQQTAAQMAKDFQAISAGLSSGANVSAQMSDMIKAAQSLHEAAPTFMTQARLDVMTGLQNRVTHALSSNSSSGSSLPASPHRSDGDNSGEMIYRAKWTVAARKAYHEESPENFAGPGMSFPIKDGSDVADAWGLAGHGDDPDAIRAKIKSIASRLGLTKYLPDTAKEDGSDDDDEGDRMSDTELIRAGSHPPFTGKHSHPHPAFGSQGEDETHEHEHAHDDDADHGHSHDDGDDGDENDQDESTEKSDSPLILRSLPSETQIYMPILRVDRAKREVVVRATAEDVDSYGTVIGFDGSKEAFSKWRGNIREMHDPTKAVGRAVKWEPSDEEKAIDLVLRVSRGAEDTWQKVLDGTLSGASIGARNGKWAKRSVGGKEIPFLERYDLVEVSLVDNPSCPGCEVKVVRADGMATDVLDFTEETVEQIQTPETDRKGARIATNTMQSMHKTRDHLAQALRENLANCSCSECQTALKYLDPDNDGDVDIIPGLDTDGDGPGGDAASGDGSGIMKVVQTEITRHMSPVLTRMNGIAARLAATDIHPTIQQVATPDETITRRLEAIEQRMEQVASADELTEVRSLLSEVKELSVGMKGLTEQIAATPQSGGPIVNSAVMRQVGSSIHEPDALNVEAAMVANLAKAGILNKNQQVEAALYLERKRLQGR